MKLYVFRLPLDMPLCPGFVGPWLVQEPVAGSYTTHPTHAEAFADAWARTHPKVAFVPIDSDTYRVVGAMPRSAVTGRYKVDTTGS